MWCQQPNLKAFINFQCSGSSGLVLLCEDQRDGLQVAVKLIPRGPEFSAAAVRRELTNQCLCRGHPHIIQLLVRGGPQGASCPQR